MTGGERYTVFDHDFGGQLGLADVDDALTGGQYLCL